MKISQRKLEIQLARLQIGDKELKKRKVTSDTLRKIRDGNEIRPTTAGKLAEVLEVDVTELIAEGDDGVRVEFQKIVEMAKAGDPMPAYCRASDELIYHAVLRTVVDYKLGRITKEDAALQHRWAEKLYNRMDDLYEVCREYNRMMIALGGYRRRAMDENNALAAEIMDRAAGIYRP